MAKLGYILSTSRGSTDPLLVDIANRLGAQGRVVAGIVQSRAPSDRDHPCDMDLVVLPNGPEIAIAQQLGTASRGCRLDPASLEEASEAVRQSLMQGADVLIVNKFGAQECKGRGFCPAFGLALERGIPVLTAVNEMNLQGFLDFAGGLETRLDPAGDQVLDWLTQPVPA
ncbi:DUF2478 domain-containing protein [Tropicibacter oceani]|uniref:DUF2478 domain-containing protein n=1 Tax=Tropicibacter oceani TaxID=3058420 RepID=A0ABY8QI32_9RHOB|nr:DUF2478 domain-containing protein [Tropicibacter oceani]WGW03638.1 DUF2478 domain-containing protein [Tropicibacter oceani]